MTIYKKEGHLIQLLPSYFRWIGVLIIILPILVLIIAKLANIELFTSHKEIAKIFCGDFIILGLFLIALTKDKIEDELTLLIRVKAMAISFIITIAYVILQPVFDLIWGDEIVELKGQKIMIGMLFVYLGYFFIQKRKR